MNTKLIWYHAIYNLYCHNQRLNDMSMTETPSSCVVFIFSIMHGAETARLNDVRRTRVSLHKSNSFPCWIRAVFEYCGSVCLTRDEGSVSHPVAKFIGPASSEWREHNLSSQACVFRAYISLLCTIRKHTCTNRPAVVLYSLWHRFSL